MPSLVTTVIRPVLGLLLLAFVVQGERVRAQAPPAADSPLVKLLKSGRAPEDRQAAIVEVIGKRGTPADLTYIFGEATRAGGFSPRVRRAALSALEEAALTRQAKPSGNLGALDAILKDPKSDEGERRSAIRLVGLWKLETGGAMLEALARDPQQTENVRTEALQALAGLGGDASSRALRGLSEKGQPRTIRLPALAALLRVDSETAVTRIAELLREDTRDVDLNGLIGAVLNQRGGADRLAAALGQTPLSADSAKAALRAVYVNGRSDAALVNELTKAAGLNQEVRPLTPEQIQTLIAEVQAQGNAARGEMVFRRAELNCMGCHAVAGAGGNVGPELSSIGPTSPVDYLINAVMVPDLAIKEEYQTRIVLTADGLVVQGIVADRDGKRLILKQADGTTRTVPVDSIEEEKEGGSLMPKGLVNFLTRAEFVDLLRFLSELGKPGPYALKTTPTIQRWKVLTGAPEALTSSVPDESAITEQILDADPARWTSVYALANGNLPLAEAVAAARSPVVYLKGELDASVGGLGRLAFDSPAGLRLWVDGKPLNLGESSGREVDLSAGHHTLLVRVETAARPPKTLRVEVSRPEGSKAEITVVGGR